MIILGCPRDFENYIMADGELAMELYQAGFVPKYKDEDVVYFKRNSKLEKFLKKLDENLV